MMSVKREQEPVSWSHSNIEKQHLNIQYSVSRVLLEATNLNDAARNILQAIGEGMSSEAWGIFWKVGVCWIIDPHTSILRCLTTWHASTVAASEFENAIRQMTFPSGLGLPGRVWASGEPAWASDVHTESNFPRQRLVSSQDLHAAFAFPIRGTSGILGVIEFFSPQISSPEENLIRAAITIGNQVGQFLERKRVEEALQDLLAREREAHATAEAATKKLEALQIVTDTALAHLALNDLLRELLSRIHQIMAVDNVAILLITDDNQYLTLRAAFGPEEEVADQVPVPIGKGFAGTIAATAKPRIIEDLSTVEIMTPILREKLTSLLGVPLLTMNPTAPSATSRVIGVIHIGTMSSRHFTEDDVQLLQRVADRVALAIVQSRLYEAEQHARNEAIVRANEQERLERHTRNSLNALLAMAEALVLVPDDADITAHTGDNSSSGSDVSMLACRLANLIRDVLECKRAAITTLDPETRQPRAVAAVGISPEQEQKWRKRESGSVLAHMFSDPTSTDRLHAGEVLTIDMTQPPFRDYPNPYDIRNMLLAPMSIGDTLVGFLVVDQGGAEHSYTSEEISMTSAVAKLAALVIERARLLRERAEARASELALRNANQRMDEFLGIASHELRTPLTTIKASIQMAERQLRNVGTQFIVSSIDPSSSSVASARLPVILELLARADQQSGVLNRLIGDLLNVSRIQANTLAMHIQPTPCDLLTIVQHAVQYQRKVMLKRNILLEAVPSEIIPVHADPDRITQVVMNFLTNALKYSSGDQPVTITLEILHPVGDSPLDRQFVRLSVSDKGPGLTLSQQEHIWERFYRVPGIEVKSGSGVGLGLGLYISKSIIERHNGQIGLSSTPGKGSTFWFTLPLAE